MNLMVGQELYYVPSEARERKSGERIVTVTKVARKWATLNNGKRINVNTLIADGGIYSPPGVCYLSKADYDIYLQTVKEWQFLEHWIRYTFSAPKGVTLDQIRQIKTILGIPVIA